MMEYHKRINSNQPIATSPTRGSPRNPAPGLCDRYQIAHMMFEESHHSVGERDDDQEYNSFVDAPLSPHTTNIVQFWEVSYQDRKSVV